MSDNEEVQLPPAFEKLITQLKNDRKMLMREKSYADPAQLRAFIGQFLFARLAEMVEMIGLGLYDTYGLAVSNANQLQRMRAVYSRALHKLGADVGDGDELPGVSTEVLDELQQAFYALGTLLQKKLPDDKETEESYNKVAELLAETVSQLMGIEPDDGEDDEDDEDEDEDEEDSEEGGDGSDADASSGADAGEEGKPDVE
jgi:hypothetical protein